MRKPLFRLCSMLLVTVMLVQMLPLSSLAEELDQSGTTETSDFLGYMDSSDISEVRILEEIEESRTEFSKEFLMSDGLRMAAVYPSAVHYEQDGQWQDIDNTLKAAGSGTNCVYTNTAGVWSVSFPQEMTEENRVAISMDGFTLRFAMAGELWKKEEAVQDKTFSEEETASETIPAMEASQATEPTMLPTEAEVEAANAEETTSPTEAATAPAETIGETVPATEPTAEDAPQESEPVTVDATEPNIDVATEPIAAETVPVEAEFPTTSIKTEQEANNTAAKPDDPYTIQSANASTAQVQEVDVAARRAEAEHPETVLDKLYSQVLYPRVYSNTNVIYNLDSNSLKESILIGCYDESLRGYRYILETEGLTPVLAENGRIDLRDPDTGDVVMVMPKPYMLDAGGAHTGDVGVTLEEAEDGSYILCYILPREWLAAEDRQWPIVLDPIVQANPSIYNIQDQSIFQYNTYDYGWGMLECGYGPNDGIERFFIKYNEIPNLTSADVIVDAQISLYKPEGVNNNATVEVHKVKGQWQSSTLQWSNRPEYDPAVEDYAIIDSSGWFSWNVTDVARGWYTGENTGMMFKATDEIEAAKVSNWKQFCSSDYNANKPTLYITFRNNNGLESYWDYTASSAGRAGTGYVNNYTGNLVWVHNDIGFGGTRMPVSISHIYNANDSLSDPYGAGMGWKTNFNQKVYQWSQNSNYYVWEDGDGTKHYFYYSSSGTYKDEDGLELTLTTTGSGTTKYCITDKFGNKSYFDTYGRLTKQENNQASKSSITVTYTSASGPYIATITDGAGRIYYYHYSGTTLYKISYCGKGSTELSYINFGHSGSQLVSVTDKDGKVSRYTYTTNNLLTLATDIDGYKLTYAYNTTEAGQPSRVSKISEFSGSTAGGELTVSYAHNQTTFQDYSGNIQIVQFNNWGNTISIQDGEGHAQYARYATDTDSTAKGNQLSAASKLQNTVGNWLKDGSFEYGSVWSSATTAVSASNVSDTAYQGNKSLKLTRSTSGVGGLYQGIYNMEKGYTYTFSAYVKTESMAGSGFYLELADDTSKACTASEKLTGTNGWTRLQVSYDVTSSSSSTFVARLIMGGTGTAYVDCVQVEKAPTASRFNLVENGDFRNGTYAWSGLSSSNIVSSSAAAPELQASVCQFTGNPLATRQASQTVYVSGSAGDTFVLSGWAKADAAPKLSPQAGDPERLFALKLIFNNTDGTKTEVTADFNPYCGPTAAWQYTAAPAVAKKAYSSVTVQILYNYNVNSAQFDGIQLYKELYGSSYAYDSSGNIVSVKDLQGKTTSYEYSSNNLTKEILPTGAALTYTYDSYHNVKTATTDTGVSYTFGYDSYGNNTSVAISSGGLSISSTAAYTSDGNRLASTQDAAGKTTTYSYNENTNVLEWVQYPKNTSTTRTNYTYDSMYRLASASANVSGLSEGTALTANYTYTNDNLTSLETASTTYTFAYGSFALRSSIKIGSRTLASYGYTSRNNYLSSLDYGNGNGVDYTYDKQGRVTKETYEDGTTVSYLYDNDGALATVKDSATGRTTSYYYDFTDRLMKYTENGSGYSHSVGYEYDSINNLTSMVENINGVNHTTSYGYDTDNRVTSVTNGSASRSYSYDSWGRIGSRTTKNNGSTVLTDTISYRSIGSASTTGQISSLKSAASGYNVTTTYTYDDNGNILTEASGGKTTSYVYDSANQLIRENNQAAGKTWVYTYDSGGNITSKKEYAYTTGTLGAATSTTSYTYGDSAWGDLLTAYNGKTITSDTIGNMLSDGTWSYTWEHGRQLKSMTGGGTTWNFKYNADGLRASRTGSKTYSYVYNGGKLNQMTVDSDTLYFAYDGSAPMSVTWNGTTYYYVTNIQGDVTAILNASGTAVVQYTYDAWGNILTTTGSSAATLGTLNPLRYRGYVYDNETGFYYVSSRYYNPEIGRWINADIFVSTGQGILGNNMFAYCNNNPIMYTDSTGCYPFQTAFEFLETWLTGDEDEQNYSEKSRIVKQLKKSKKMQSYIDSAIKNYKSGQLTTTGYGEFTAGEDGYELYLSTQHFNYAITVAEEARTVGIWFWKHEETRYTVTVTVHDTYNFDTFREWNSFGNIMNDLAYAYHILGGGNDFEWFATYTYSTKWTDAT